MKKHSSQYWICILSVLLFFGFTHTNNATVTLHVDAEKPSYRNSSGVAKYFLNKSARAYSSMVLEWQGGDAGTSSSVWIEPNIYRQGSYGLGFRTNPNPSSGLRNRTEYWFEGSRSGTNASGDPIGTSIPGGGVTTSSKIDFGERRVTGFSARLWKDIPGGGSFIFTQYYQYSPAFPAVDFYFVRKNGFWRIGIGARGDNNWQTGSAADVIADPLQIPRPVQDGNGEYPWVDFIVDSKLQPGGGSYITVQASYGGAPYQLIGNSNGITDQIGYSQNWHKGGTPTSQSYRHKFGIYRPASSTLNHIVYMDEVRSSSNGSMIEVGGHVINQLEKYQLQVAHSQLCLAIGGNSTQNSAAAQQYTCTAGGNLLWKFIPQGGGYYQIRASHSNKCLTVAGWGNPAKQVNQPIQQYTCNSGSNTQLWRPWDRGNGKYEMSNKYSGHCLAVSGNSQALGQPTVQHYCDQSANRLWKFH